jgi:filamentous hemagglutinin
VASIDRGVTELQQDGLKDIFDQQAVAERMEMAQLAGEVGFQAAGDIAGRMGWEEGSKERTALHGVVGAAMAALGGGSALEGLTGAVANQLAFNAMRGYLTDTLGMQEGSEGFNLLLQLGSAAVGAAVGGETGASTALSATNNNWLKHWEFEALKEAEGACGQGNQAACRKAEELRALDQSRDRDYAAYATSILENMRAEGVTPTEEEFSRRMDGYWSANQVDRRDVVYPEGGHIPSYPTRGEELYGFLGRLAENLPDWYPGKAPTELSTTLMQGLLEQGGEAVAGWADLFTPAEAVNWFTGESVTGVDAWQARFGSGAELVAGWLTGGGNNVVRAGVEGLGSTADNVLDDAAQATLRNAQGIYGADGKPLMDFSFLSASQKMVVGDILGESKILNLVPDGKFIGRSQGVGQPGIDNILQVNRPDVDYVIVEYKFETSRLGSTLDGIQGSDTWTLGADRIRNSVGDPDLALHVANAVRSGRVERWVVNTDRYGNVAVGLLDKNGKFIKQPRSALFGGGG